MSGAPHSFPADLIERLHAATERLHESRQDWERALQGTEYRHQERVDAARERLLEAERAVEQVEALISQALSA